ncbi:MAG TPA: PAS domain-containing protein [Candidatus Acidoferrales bacterium]|nr:PAS domain-containing protein [Candidatus Acidoferrales bacterium]
MSEPKYPNAEASVTLVMDAGGLVVEWSAAAEQLFGWPRAEAVGRRLSELIIPARHRAAHEAGLKQFLAGGPGALLNRAIKISAIDRGSREFEIEVRITAKKTSDGYQFATSARRLDVS